MKKWLRRIRGALGMGLTWGIGWGCVGMLGEVFDPHGRIIDIWPAVFAYPGFLGGVVFSMVLWVAEGRRRFDQLSVPRFGALGACAGVLLGLVPFVLGTPTSELPLWVVGGIVIGFTTSLCAISAAGSLALARMAERRESLEAGADVSDVGLTDGEVRELLGGR